MEDFKKIFYDKKEGLTNINKLYEKIHEAKEYKKELANKRIDIDESNIIEGKRERKPKIFYD